MRHLLQAVIAGGLLAAGAAPSDRWYLAVAGLAVLYSLTTISSHRMRLLFGWLASTTMFVITLSWTSQFSEPGWIALALFQALFYGVGVLAAGTRKPKSGARPALAFVAAMTLAELARTYFPFGGFPMGSITTSAVDSPLAPLSGAVGEVGLMALLASLAVALHALFSRARFRHVVIIPLCAISASVIATGANPVTASGENMSVFAVQGGGPQGLSRAEQTPDLVFERHLHLARQAPADTDLIIWPENTVSVRGALESSPEAQLLGQLAREQDSFVAVGVVESIPPRFRNSQVLFSPNGAIVDRYEKVLRVPFGEYVPARNFFSQLGDLSQVPNDAIAGTGPGYLDVGATRIAVAISYEGLFSRRVAEGVRQGAQAVVIPTNAASYEDPRVGRTQIQAARLRSLETGRNIIQAGPTGITAHVDERGRVLQQSKVGEAFALSATVPLFRGTSTYNLYGDWPLFGLALVALLTTWASQRGRREPDQGHLADEQTESC